MKKVDNTQHLIFLKSLLTSVQKSEFAQKESIMLTVHDKVEGIPSKLEVNGNANGFLLYRVITSAGESLWNSWEEPEHIKNSFRMMSLI